jgi:hypothetical protein
VPAATTGPIDNERTDPWCEQLHDLRREHRPVIDKILHFLRLLFEIQRTGREPNRPLKQQCVHIISDQTVRLQTDYIRDVLISWRFFLMGVLPALQIPNFKAPTATDEGDLTFQSDFPAKLVRQNETALSIRGTVLRARVKLPQEDATIPRRNALVRFRR